MIYMISFKISKMNVFQEKYKYLKLKSIENKLFDTKLTQQNNSIHYLINIKI